ncbi:MAG: polysaccharide biosynthesis protein [Oscillospiraceae bacterium]|nr:polysaccharide biosynthesis protein [Oscillospiraceae bacterium]
MEEKHARSVASGALLLIASNFIVKIVGFVYKIPIANVLGDAALGYFSTAFEIFTLLLTIFISGGSIAVSKMISDSAALGHWAEVKKTFRILAVMLSVVGFVGTAIMFFGAEAFSTKLDNPLAALSIAALSPAIFFLSVSCLFRGFFQGLGDMRPSSLSEVIEALFKLLIGIGFTMLLRSLGYGDHVLSAGAISGTTLSVLISVFVMFGAYALSSKRREVRRLAQEDVSVPASSFRIVGRFWKLALPIALSSVVVNLTSVLDLFLIFDRLIYSGMSVENANRVYGAYKGYAQSLFNLAPSIISSINISILPTLSAYFVTRQREKAKNTIEQSLKVVNLLAFPAAIGLLVLAEPISRLLYPARLDEIGVAIPILKILAIASYWTSISTIMTSLLQSSGKTHLPLISLAAGGAVKLTVNYFLVAVPSLGINGAPIGTLCCYIVMVAINTVFLFKTFGKVDGKRLKVFRWCVKPLISAAIMGAAAYWSQIGLDILLPERIATVLSIFIAVVVYGVTILLVRGVTKSDLIMLPGGTRLSAILVKLRLLKTN